MVENQEDLGQQMVFFSPKFNIDPLRNHSYAREYPEPHVTSTRVAHNHNTMLTDLIRAHVVVVVVSSRCCRLLNEATPFSDPSDLLVDVLSNRKVYLPTLLLSVGLWQAVDRRTTLPVTLFD